MSCKKEEVPAKISGYILEAGTDRPVRKAHVAIIGKDILTGEYSIVEDILADENGHYVFETTHFPTDKGYYVLTAASDYYDYNLGDMYNNLITPYKKSFNLYLVRENKTVIKAIRNHSLNNEGADFRSERQAPIFIGNISSDTLITVNSNLFVNTTFSIDFFGKSGINSHVDTFAYYDSPLDTFVFYF